MTFKLIQREFVNRLENGRQPIDTTMTIRRRQCRIRFHIYKKDRQAQNEDPVRVYGRRVDQYGRIQEPRRDLAFYLYKNNLYCFDDLGQQTEQEQELLIKAHYFKNEKKFRKLQKEIKLFEKLESGENQKSREPIPEDVRFAVWRRDSGKCVKCGGNRNLEFDHIIPVSKGGSNTERNIQVLCEHCNREKADKI